MKLFKLFRNFKQNLILPFLFRYWAGWARYFYLSTRNTSKSIHYWMPESTSDQLIPKKFWGVFFWTFFPGRCIKIAAYLWNFIYGILRTTSYNIKTRTKALNSTGFQVYMVDWMHTTKMATEWQFALFKPWYGEVVLTKISRYWAFASCSFYLFDKNCWQPRTSEQTTVNGLH